METEHTGSRLASVFFKRIGTAGSGAEPALEKVEFQVDAVIRLQFMFMHCPVESLHGVTADREFHVFRGCNQDALPCGIAQCCETDIRALAVFLRHDIRDVHFIDCGPVESDRISRFSVTVVFLRSASEPCDIFKVRREFQQNADSRQVIKPLVDFKTVLEMDHAIRTDHCRFPQYNTVFEHAALPD